MHELFGLARFVSVEAQRAAIAVGVARANRPGGVVALMIAFEVAVTVDEVADAVAQLLERTEHLGAGGRPVAGLNESLETQLAEVILCAAVKLGLHFKKKRRRVLVARGFFIGDVPERTKGHSAFFEDVAVCLLEFPGSKRGLCRSIFLRQPVAELLFE